MIIGLTGENCAGKGTVADYLKKKGFYYLSLSDVIREELKADGGGGSKACGETPPSCIAAIWFARARRRRGEAAAGESRALTLRPCWATRIEA